MRERHMPRWVSGVVIEDLEGSVSALLILWARDPCTEHDCVILMSWTESPCLWGQQNPISSLLHRLLCSQTDKRPPCRRSAAYIK
jgi:hypothetical protein